MRKTLVLITVLFLSVGGYYALTTKNVPQISTSVSFPQSDVNEGEPDPAPHPLSIEALRQGEYPGSEIIIEQTLNPGTNYQRFIASYKSEGLKIYGLLTVPDGVPPESGRPAIIFNHGYISPFGV